MEQQRNLLLAIVISIAILLGFELMYRGTAENTGDAPRAEQQAETGTPEAERAPGAAAPDAGKSGGAETGGDRPDRETVIADTPRVAIDTPKLRGSISLIGGRVDDLTLRRYHRENSDDSPKVTLLSPKGSRDAYYASFGWVGVDGPAEVPTDLSSPRAKLVYLYLSTHGEATIADLQADLGMKKIALYGVLRSLREEGIVDRETDRYVLA